MERRTGDNLLLFLASALVCWCFLAASPLAIGVGAATGDSTVSADLRRLHYREEYRRNLLANGLGVTPPMGYVLLLLLLLLCTVLSLCYRDSNSAVTASSYPL